MRNLQDIRTEKVLASLGCCSFITESGIVIEGNYRKGEYAPVVYDKSSHRYLGVWKTHRDDPPRRRDEDDRLAGVKRTPTCIVTLLDLPDMVRPMQNNGVIAEGELEGIDYIKTYYTVNVSDCSGCNPVPEWRFELVAWQSIDGTCWAEIIEQGEDGNGKYIIWKAYTEAANFSRTGLADLTLFGNIKDSLGVVCQGIGEISVDCCEKDSEDRLVEIWWEKVPDGGGESIVYEGKTLYKTPGDASLEDLKTYTLYMVPEIKGGCLPFHWTLTGPGVVQEQDVLNASVKYSPPTLPEEVGCDDVSILVEDRCKGSTDQVDMIPCCEDESYVMPGIGYTTLVMEPGTAQTLSATGGCWPFTWEKVSGVGALVGSGRNAVYTAPDQNNEEGCGGNAVIRLTDCCGNSDEITIVLTTPTHVPALYYYEWRNPTVVALPGNPGCMVRRWELGAYLFYCDSTYDDWAFYNYVYLALNEEAPPIQRQSVCGSPISIGCNNFGAECGEGGCDGYLAQMITSKWTENCWLNYNHEIWAAGAWPKGFACCPINPWTQFPFHPVWPLEYPY